MGQIWSVPVFFSAPHLYALVAAALVTPAAIAGWRWWRAARFSPAERERRRREELMARGKMGDATLLEIRDTLVFYSYDVRGMEYIASQDVAGLHDALPSDPDAIGPVLVKYDARNPANSIIAAEQWSGIRKTGIRGFRS